MMFCSFGWGLGAFLGLVLLVVVALRLRPRASDPLARGPQIVGEPCASCAREIAVEKEATVCAVCKAPAHRATCIAGHMARTHADAQGPYRA